jgi:hypothetical protein
LEKRKRGKFYRNDNRDSYKEEIKIPPPHPYKRQILIIFLTRRIHIFSANINYSSHSKYPYFLSPGLTAAETKDCADKLVNTLFILIV